MKTIKKWGVAILLIGSLLGAQVNAASFTLKATPSKTTVEPGDTITIDIAISNIDIENGINTVEGYLEYDENILEPVTQDSFSAKSNWSTTYNDQGGDLNGKFLIVTLSQGEVSDQSIATLTLKLKETATKGTSTQVKLKNLSTNDGSNLISETDKIITLNIKGEEIPAPVTNTQKQPEKEKENISPKPIPQTGEKWIIPGIVVAIGAIGIFAYVKFHNYRKI